MQSSTSRKSIDHREAAREGDQQAPVPAKDRKQLRLYLIGFRESAWEMLSEALYARYPSVDVHFETALTRDVGLVLSLLMEVENLDPNFFNALRSEKRIAWWEYPSTRPAPDGSIQIVVGLSCKNLIDSSSLLRVWLWSLTSCLPERHVTTLLETEQTSGIPLLDPRQAISRFRPWC